MGSAFICSCPCISQKYETIEIKINQKEINMLKNKDYLNVEKMTIENSKKNLNEFKKDFNNKNINNNNLNLKINRVNSNSNINNSSIYSIKDNLEEDNQMDSKRCLSDSIANSFNVNKSITPSNNPLGGLVKLIPKNV